MKKIKILKPIPGFAYFEGDIVTVKHQLAKAWIEDGYAKEIKKASKK